MEDAEVTWFKLDDGFPDHPKVVAAGELAAWLFVVGGCYSSRYQTDGKIPKALLPRLTAMRNVQALAGVLVANGLWHDEGDHYEIHDFLDYNPSKAQTEEERERRSAAGALGAAKRWGATGDGAQMAGAMTAASDKSDAPGPARPLSSDVPNGTSRARSRGTRIPDDFAVTPEMQDWVEATYPLVNWRESTQGFVDWAKSTSSRNGVKKDWVRAWRNWMRGVDERRRGVRR